MGRRPNTAQRKQEIVMALLAVMAEYGYEKSTIQLIAKEAGLAPGLVHYHFKTKMDILLSLIDWITSSAKLRQDSFTKKASSPLEKLEAFINARLLKGDSAMPQVVAAWVVIAGESITQPQVREIYQALMAEQLGTLKDLISQAWQNKTPQCKEVVELSAVVMSAIEGSYLLSATAPDVMPTGYAADMVLEMLRHKVLVGEPSH